MYRLEVQKHSNVCGKETCISCFAVHRALTKQQVNWQHWYIYMYVAKLFHNGQRNGFDICGGRNTYMQLIYWPLFKYHIRLEFFPGKVSAKLGSVIYCCKI